MKNAGEKAMALVDGQLAPAEVPDLVQELARSAPLIAELQDYLAVSQSRLAATYADKAEEPVPAWLIDTVRRGPVADGRSRAAFARGLLWLQTYRVPAWSLAAAPALTALALLAVWLVASTPSRGLLVEASLGTVLDGAVSGKDAPVASLRPVLSFKSTSAGWCRQFEVRHADKQVSYALACRGEAGHWDVVASTQPGSGGLMPAGADRRKAIDDLVTSMMRGQPLSQAEEAATIGRGWR
jgi:hypothetical protein